MSHLDDAVAAYVDGQLGAAATVAADRHLRDCERCRVAVAAQRQLKHRMRASAAVEPPAGLLEALEELPSAPAPMRPPWWRRVLRSPLWGATGVVVGASVVVAMAAYLAGSPTDEGGDVLVPPVDVYTAEFIDDSIAPDPAPATSVSTTGMVVAGTMSVRAMRDLTAKGWPCHGHLGKRLERIRGQLHDAGRVRLVYSDGRHRLELHEQDGTLDTDRLEGFVPASVDPASVGPAAAGGAPVWVRQSAGPRVIVWDRDGVVYTVVTDADNEVVAQALADLPSPEARAGLTGRLGRGIARVTGWMA